MSNPIELSSRAADFQSHLEQVMEAIHESLHDALSIKPNGLVLVAVHGVPGQPLSIVGRVAIGLPTEHIAEFAEAIREATSSALSATTGPVSGNA